ncbi:hypothetical protein ACXJY6_12770 [Vibrio sp. RC27]
MDDDSLAPFVDALSSALIIMVLVCIFFMLQTATSLSSAARQHTLNNIEEEDKSPIIYQQIIRANLDEHQFDYLINFKLEKEFVEQIKAQLQGANKVEIVIQSRDNNRKNTVNLMRFLAYLKLPSDIKVHTSMKITNNVVSTVKWEIE